MLETGIFPSLRHVSLPFYLASKEVSKVSTDIEIKSRQEKNHDQGRHRISFLSWKWESSWRVSCCISSLGNSGSSAKWETPSQNSSCRIGFEENKLISTLSWKSVSLKIILNYPQIPQYAKKISSEENHILNWGFLWFYLSLPIGRKNQDLCYFPFLSIEAHPF